ncbi:hypothetical protein Oweho_1438 [Owenweeksia hongkongensis DSM 17368]|uniref:SGNH hydrolase-type esterase domain-containing protein n=1 Tax=Owenweeksia hongkongensis (strain DSM 17368 / CIP 108786 / JCM 12287 / NRRL B-23963 / UST20020801) TaxID=926562 RepID=G8R866_OWEHD|nr:GDSL-type esterase/lipase family protein [Owenweeksia hongkongensis]AEV32434.1 hypothetical protein Oweho_1438 [Owenweeksia hongkongensis DSM 17368]
MKKTLLSLFFIVFLSIPGKSNDTLNPCVRGQAFHLVILGSSTAAGAGPSSSANAWVNRYRTFLQSINPQNQVTNLAQGGTTTYHIMPDWFVAPSGRPTTNALRNVSEAIRLQADGIIVNMPSNDAAGGFTVNEQMANFILIAQVADSAGIPVWVCTTQPRNFSTAKVQIQEGVRDSILSYFGAHAIDFWTGFADSTGQMGPTFDSGDGVHMNDTAHQILFERVRDKQIFSQLIDTLSVPEHSIYSIENTKMKCGTEWDTVFIQLSNVGAPSTYNLPIKWEVENLLQSSVSTEWDTIFGGVNTCESFTQTLAINTSNGGKWMVSASLITTGDSLTVNDFSDTLTIIRQSLPTIATQNDTICAGDSASFFASGGDTIVWYNAMDSIIGFGPFFNTSALQQSEVYRASAVYGEMTFKESLFTTDNSSISYNGIMFDLIANDSLVIDSLALKAAVAGVSGVTAYYVNKSHFGLEDSAQAWTMWGTDTISASVADQFCNVNFGSISLQAGDTLGVYLMMQNGTNLRYLSASQVANFTSSKLTLTSGTGKAHNFGASYFPRIWNGEVFYHFGFNPEGDCATDTLIEAIVNAGDIYLGNDTSIALNQSLLLSLGGDYSQIMWSTGDTSRQLLIDGNVLGAGLFTYYVQAIDRFGCLVHDTIIVAIGQPLSLIERRNNLLQLYPNPTQGKVSISCDCSFKNGYLAVISSEGQRLRTIPIKESFLDMELDLSNLPNGTYWLHLFDEKGVNEYTPLVINH